MNNFKVIYAWALNARPLQLPENVGFQVGAGTKIQYLVLQIHYSRKFEGNTNHCIKKIYKNLFFQRMKGISRV